MKKTALMFVLMMAVINVQTDKTPCELAEAVIRSQAGRQKLPELLKVSPRDDAEEFSEWLSDYYHIDGGQVSDGIIYYADGVEAAELAILAVHNGAGEPVSSALRLYVQERAKVFEGYAPVQAAMARNGLVIVRDGYAAMMILPDIQAARRAFMKCLDSGKAEALTDSYNHDDVLKAYRTGDKSSLSGMNREILEGAENVIRSEIRGGMTDYDKELAIHDWITHNSAFDYGIFRRSGKITDGTDSPYGVLVKHSAICHGYSSTFQLFMDMLGIECLTVWGRPDSRGVMHSWNMVCLDGEWYCVDTAWDDPIGGSPSHRFFNVTSEYLRGSGIHYWDERNIPEAEGTKYRFKH